MAHLQLLSPVLAALERLDYPRAFLKKVEHLFAVVSRHRPDLTERSRLAAQEKNTVELERVLDETLTHFADMQRAGLLLNDNKIPTFSVRFNHATGYLHGGYSERRTPIFPPAR